MIGWVDGNSEERPTRDGLAERADPQRVDGQNGEDRAPDQTDDIAEHGKPGGRDRDTGSGCGGTVGCDGQDDPEKHGRGADCPGCLPEPGRLERPRHELVHYRARVHPVEHDEGRLVVEAIQLTAVKAAPLTRRDCTQSLGRARPGGQPLELCLQLGVTVEVAGFDAAHRVPVGVVVGAQLRRLEAHESAIGSEVSRLDTRDPVQAVAKGIGETFWIRNRMLGEEGLPLAKRHAPGTGLAHRAEDRLTHLGHLGHSLVAERDERVAELGLRRLRGEGRRMNLQPHHFPGSLTLQLRRPRQEHQCGTDRKQRDSCDLAKPDHPPTDGRLIARSLSPARFESGWSTARPRVGPRRRTGSGHAAPRPPCGERLRR